MTEGMCCSPYYTTMTLFGCDRFDNRYGSRSSTLEVRSQFFRTSSWNMIPLIVAIRQSLARN